MLYFSVKKSFSVSLSNFFRKMSPSTIRRSRGRHTLSVGHQASFDSLDSTNSSQGETWKVVYYIHSDDSSFF